MDRNTTFEIDLDQIRILKEARESVEKRLNKAGYVGSVIRKKIFRQKRAGFGQHNPGLRR